MTHTITILGSTGSIGRQTLSVAEELGLRVAALTAERTWTCWRSSAANTGRNSPS